MLGSIGDSYARVMRAIYGSWWIFLGCFYVMVIGVLLSVNGAFIAESLGLSATSFEGLLLDLTLLVVVPFSALIWLHLRRHDGRNLRAKEQFLDQHGNDTLVVSKFGPLDVYKVCGERNGELRVEAIWNADGPVSEAKSQYVKADRFTEFDAEAFLRH